LSVVLRLFVWICGIDHAAANDREQGGPSGNDLSNSHNTRYSSRLRLSSIRAMIFANKMYDQSSMGGSSVRLHPAAVKSAA
jgi:hypothetical protein